MRSFRLPLPLVLTLTALVDGAAILAAGCAWLVLAGQFGTAWIVAGMVTLPLVAWGAAFASIAGTKLIVDLAFDAEPESESVADGELMTADDAEATSLAWLHAR